MNEAIPIPIKMGVHPLADIFPMLAEDELADLAADIKANGLVHPIVLGTHDGAEVIVDGRNRFKACELAGVEPQFRRLNGEDIGAFIVSANLQRRNLTKGQQAMALAMIYPEAAKLKRKGSGSSVTEKQGVTAERLSVARAVLHHSRALAEEVLAGAKQLDAALQTVRIEENRAHSAEAKMTALRSEASDLADLVIEGRMTLDEADAAFMLRQKKIRDAIDSGKQYAAHKLIEFVATVQVIAQAMSLTDERFLSKNDVALVMEATERLKQLPTKEERP